MKNWKRILLTLALLVGVSAPALLPTDASAVNVFSECQTNNQDNAICKAQTTDSATNMVTIVINILLYIIGIIAVIMIVVGGVRYTVSNGNASQVKEAKDTILYAVIGLIVAIMAYAIVNFVLSRFIGGTS